MRSPLSAIIAFLIAAAPLTAQTTATPEELAKRLEALEKKVEALQSADAAELKREIAILAQEVDSLKNERVQKPVEASSAQYGLGAAASKVYRSDVGVSIGGYGEMLVQKPSTTLQNGEHVTPSSSANLERAVLYTGYKFNPHVVFNSELEIEGGSTEHGGEASMEFAYLDFLLRPEANIRAGVVLMPVGFINEGHEPNAYLTARRPLVEDRIIPTTWTEMGTGIVGDSGPFTYRTYITTGLDSSRFDAESGIHEGKQSGANAIANDLAWVGRADYHPLEGALVGGSYYAGNSGQAREVDGRRITGRVNLGELHAEVRMRGLLARALWSRGTTGDAALINEANGYSGAESIGSRYGGWYTEAGYDLFSVWPHGEMSLTPYVHYEQLDTQMSVPTGYERNPENDLKVFTVGAGFKPIPQAVLKLDYQHITNRARTAAPQWNFALGYIF